tara:strand:- start:601 stop:1125 length:525 start_codon:yes stop_codon:yes gene_type:complete
MPLGGFDRDFKKPPSTKIIKEDNSELYENLQKQLKLLRVQTNNGVTEVKELKKCIESISIEMPDSLLESLRELKQDINNLQKKQISLSLAASRALTEMANLLDSKFEELKETQVKVDYKAINLQFKNVQTILTQQKLNIQLLTNELEKKNPWISVLIGCAIGLSGVLGYVVSLI